MMISQWYRCAAGWTCARTMYCAWVPWCCGKYMEAVP